MVKKRKTSLRKCVVTKEMFPKETLIRVVRNKEGEVFVDPTGKKNGRGAYVSKSKEVILRAKETGVLRTHLQAEIDPSIYDQLEELVESDSI